MIKILLSIVSIFFLASETLANLPSNNLDLEDSLYNLSEMSEQTFEEAINEVYEVYAPIAESLGFTLKIDGDWVDSTVNAYTMRQGKEWYIHMYGGLARRPEVTVDGFKLVICHELGHQMGGWPMSGWASYEGQADYAATYICGKKMFSLGLDENLETSKYCRNYQTQKDKALCTRNLAAGQSLANLLAALRGGSQPSYSTPDQTIVRSTSSYHPQAQCRLDTYFAGAVCPKAWDDKIIPKKDGAVCSNRPRCWFKNMRQHQEMSMPSVDFTASMLWPLKIK